MFGKKETKLIPGGPIERECAKPQIKIVRWTQKTWDPLKRYGPWELYKQQRKRIKRDI